MEELKEKPKRKVERKPISPERKAMLLENLKKARVRAAEVREEKKAMKAEIKAKEKKTQKKVEPAKKVAPAIDPRDAEILRLRNQVKNFSLQDIARKSKPKPKPKRPDTPPPQDVKNEMIQITETPIIIEDEVENPPDSEYEPPKTIAKPKQPPPSPQQPPIPQPEQSPPQMRNTLPQIPQAPKPYKAFRKKKMRNY
jgi:hypothetical protein